MGVRVIVGTEKGGFVCESDDSRASFKVQEPLFKGWKVTASARTSTGRTIVATASRVYGAAIQVSDDDGAKWRQVENGPAYEEGALDILRELQGRLILSAAKGGPGSAQA